MYSPRYSDFEFIVAHLIAEAAHQQRNNPGFDHLWDNRDRYTLPQVHQIEKLLSYDRIYRTNLGWKYNFSIREAVALEEEGNKNGQNHDN